MPSNPTVFEIGITMAGAISAGAYSGGVFDFLCEALSEWDRARAATPDAVPNHRACIKVISGASAGSVTGALATVALAKGMNRGTAAGKPGYGFTLPAVYDVWVRKIDLAQASKDNDLLAVDDLAGPQRLKSLLNTLCIDRTAQQVLADNPGGDPVAYSWLGAPFHCYFVLTNTRGVPYEILFQSGVRGGGHGMMNHGDREHFTIQSLGSGPGDNAWCRGDATVEFDAEELRTGKGPHTDRYMTAALASSAFPVGLSARTVGMEVGSYTQRNWACIDLQSPHSLVPAPGFPTEPMKMVPFATVDGGLIDNEPFEYAHRGILADGEVHNATDPNQATKAVIMIDPFPEAPDFSLDDKLSVDGSLLTIVKGIFPVLKDQVRFKPNEAAIALDPDSYSRYLISPRRSDADPSLSSAPLATSVLGGFGGFLDIAFREHDYQLGRRNCQRFLREHFAVGLQNPIAWQDGHWNNAAYTDRQFRDEENQNVVVIPLCGTAVAEVEAPQWPRISLDRLAEIEKRIAARLDVLMPKIFKEEVGAAVFRTILQYGWQHVYGREETLKFVHWVIFGQLVARDQLAEYKGISVDARNIAVALSSSQYDYWSDQGLATAIKGTLPAVAAALDQLRGARLEIWSGSVAGKSCHTWQDKRPNWFQRNIPGWSVTPTIG